MDLTPESSEERLALWVIGAAAILALIGGGLTFVITQTSTNKPQKEPERPVVIALAEFPEGALITTDKLQVQNWPESIVPPGSISSLADLNGKFAKVRIAARTPLVLTQLGGVDVTKLTTNAGPAGLTGAPKGPTLVDAEYTLEKGQVLVVVKQIAPIYRGIRVRGIGSLDPTITTAEVGSLIFAVPAQDALILKFIENMNPDLLLRAAGDTGNAATDLVTQDYMVRRYNLERPLAAGSPTGPPGIAGTQGVAPR
ncbi:MAG: hypothetical protein NTZ05_00115 [Chloroflexi bacterium]|nr:hypothetical protein [Chloroflexota bacterium]